MEWLNMANLWRFQYVSIFHHSSIIVIFLSWSVLVPLNFEPLQSFNLWDYTVGGATFKCGWEELLFATPNRNANIVWHCFNGARKKTSCILDNDGFTYEHYCILWWWFQLFQSFGTMDDDWSQFGSIAVGICRCWSCWLVSSQARDKISANLSPRKAININRTIKLNIESNWAIFYLKNHGIQLFLRWKTSHERHSAIIFSQVENQYTTAVDLG